MLGVAMFTPYDQDKNRENKIIGNFNMQAFKIPHGEITNYGLLVKHKNGESLLYLTDFSHTQYNFRGCRINHFLVECNWQKQYVDIESENFRHKILDHCSLDTCKELIKANKTPSMRSVILCHLGKGSTNPKECVSEIGKLVESNVFVDYARKNTTYELR